MKSKQAYNNEMQIDEIFKLFEDDVTLTCPKCESDLLMPTYLDSETGENRLSGLFCPINQNHLTITYNYGSRSLWDKINKLNQKT
jgi:hypothetical protein